MKTLLYILVGIIFFVAFLIVKSFQGLKQGSPFGDHYQIKTDKVLFVERMQGLGIIPKYTLKDADPETFKILEDYYGKDKSHVYWRGKLLDKCQPASFKILSDLYSKDERFVYYGNTKFSEDASNFTILNKYFTKDRKNGYYIGEIISDGNGKTLEVIYDTYAKDHKHVYLGTKKISEDTNGFVILEKNGKQVYAKDRTYAYRDGKKIEDADGATFRSFGNLSYFADENFAFFAGRKIEGSHGPSFEPINENYAKDKHYVYRGGNVLEKAKPHSFKVLLYGYSLDAKYVFYNATIITDKPTNFRVIGKRGIYVYASDGNDLYIGNSKIKDVNPRRLKLLRYRFSKDNKIVLNGRNTVPGAHAPSFEVLNKYYQKDQQNIFYKGEIVEGADVATFEIHRKRPNLARDKYRYYASGKPNNSYRNWVVKK